LRNARFGAKQFIHDVVGFGQGISNPLRCQNPSTDEPTHSGVTDRLRFVITTIGHNFPLCAVVHDRSVPWGSNSLDIDKQQ
jgi:hypothetical protein